MKITYLASPYSHSDERVREKNYQIISEVAAFLVSKGEVVISPITYGHTLLSFREMPGDWEFWKNFCISILSKCDKMIVCTMPGWDISRGVTEEIRWAQENNIEIEYLDPNLIIYSG
jgi:hypothetical protein